MDGRAFKVIKENKKAEAKKVLLWMLLMVFAVLIVVLIVYMSYNRYMPSFLGWFKEEEDIVVEPVKEEIRIEQNVINEFVKLEKTISSALSEERAVEIMLDIEKIESKLKDENGKQYNLALEGQKIKLIDKSIEGSIPDQTVMEFAITTDEGIWIKADFESLDKHKEYECIQLKNYEINEKFICWNELEGKRIEIAPLSNSECNDPVKIIPIEMNNCKKQEDEYQQINFKFYQEIKEFLENPELCYYELNFKQIKSTSPIGIFYDNSGKEFLIKDVYGQGIRDRKKFENLEIGGDTQFDSENGDWIILSSDTHRDNIITIEKKDGRAVLNVYSPGNVRYESLNSKIDYASAEFSCDGYNKAMKDIETFNECLKEFEKEGNEIVACEVFENALTFYKDKDFVEFGEIKAINQHPLRITFDKELLLNEQSTETIYNLQNIYLSKRAFDYDKNCWQGLDSNTIKIRKMAPPIEEIKSLFINGIEYKIISPNNLCEYQEPVEELLTFLKEQEERGSLSEMRFENKLSLILKDYAEFYGEDYFNYYEDEFLSKNINLKLNNEKELEIKYIDKILDTVENIRQVSLLYQVEEKGEYDDTFKKQCVETSISAITLTKNKILEQYRINCNNPDCKYALDFDEFKIKKIKQGADTKLVIAFEDSYDCFDKYDAVPYIDVLISPNNLYNEYFIEYDSEKNTIVDSFGNDVKDYKLILQGNSFFEILKFNSDTNRFETDLRNNQKHLIISVIDDNIQIRSGDYIHIEIGEDENKETSIILTHVYGNGGFYKYYPKKITFSLINKYYLTIKTNYDSK